MLIKITRYFKSNSGEISLVRFAGITQHHNTKNLQQQKAEEIKVLPYEQENIFQCLFAVLSHDEWKTLIVFQRQSCTSNHTLQRIVCNMYRQFDLRAQTLVQTT